MVPWLALGLYLCVKQNLMNWSEDFSENISELKGLYTLSWWAVGHSGVVMAHVVQYYRENNKYALSRTNCDCSAGGEGCFFLDLFSKGTLVAWSEELFGYWAEYLRALAIERCLSVNSNSWTVVPVRAQTPLCVGWMCLLSEVVVHWCFGMLFTFSDIMHVVWKEEKRLAEKE